MAWGEAAGEHPVEFGSPTMPISAADPADARFLTFDELCHPVAPVDRPGSARACRPESGGVPASRSCCICRERACHDKRECRCWRTTGQSSAMTENRAVSRMVSSLRR